MAGVWNNRWTATIFARTVFNRNTIAKNVKLSLIITIIIIIIIIKND